MLTASNLNTDEIKIIQHYKKGIKAYVFFFIKLFIPLSFILGILGLLKKSSGYWPATIFFLIIFFVVTIYLMVKEHYTLTKDLKDKVKYAGLIRVLNKSKNERTYEIFTDSEDFKKINVGLPLTFNQIEIGDELYIEAVKSSRLIFKLKKGKLLLINAC